MATAAVTAKARLADYIATRGPVPTVRVASVTVGGLTNTPLIFWDAVPGQVQILGGAPWHVTFREPRPRFNSGLEAGEYAEKLAQVEGRLQVFYGARSLTEAECADVLRRLGQ